MKNIWCAIVVPVTTPAPWTPQDRGGFAPTPPTKNFGRAAATAVVAKSTKTLTDVNSKWREYKKGSIY